MYIDSASESAVDALTSKSGLVAKKYEAQSKIWTGLGDSNRALKRLQKAALRKPMREPMAPNSRLVGGMNRLVKQSHHQVPPLKSRLRTIQLENYRWSQAMRSTRRHEASNLGLAVTSLDKAVQMLAALTTDEAQLSQGALRMQTARLLRRAAVDQDRQSPRVASVALLLSDALLNSALLEATAERRNALRLGLDLLMDSFVPQEREEQLVRALLDAGWEITAPFNQDEFADLIEQVSG